MEAEKKPPGPKAILSFYKSVIPIVFENSGLYNDPV